MTHGGAVAAMVAATLLWSIAGLVTRHLEVATGFEATFWRSAVNAVALVVLLSLWKGPSALPRALRRGGRTLWLSGLCWAVMYTAFMVAITMTTVANVLVTMALAPLVTALLARVVLGRRLGARTWAAVVVAGIGIAWMYGHELGRGSVRDLLGTLVALGVPIAAASNWTLIQAHAGRAPSGGAGPSGGEMDLLAAVFLGAVGSALVTLVPAWPFQATRLDLGLLGLLGVFQLAVPCLIAVVAARRLGGPEAALLSVLEIVFGVAWTWLFSPEKPSPAVLGGGLLVVGALVAHEAAALPWLARRSAPPRTAG